MGVSNPEKTKPQKEARGGKHPAIAPFIGNGAKRDWTDEYSNGKDREKTAGLDIGHAELFFQQWKRWTDDDHGDSKKENPDEIGGKGTIFLPHIIIVLAARPVIPCKMQ